MRTWIFTIVLFLFSLFFSVPRIFAVSEFTTTLRAQYTVDARGNTHVKQEIRIVNNISTIYVTQYSFDVGSTTLQNVRVIGKDGAALPTSVTTTGGNTHIALHFPDKVVGKDKERIFIIEYDHPDIAVVAGNVLEVDIPSLVKPDQFQTYSAVLQVPASFGDPVRVEPSTYIPKHTDQTYEMTFNQAYKGVHVLFGTKQIYRFQLRYHVSNPSISPGVSQVALPPDTNYQKIQYTAIQPKPDSIEKDKDGNWIATFTVGGQKEMDITAEGYATVFLEPTTQVPSGRPDKAYTQPQKYWETQDPEIQKLAKQLKTPQAIYNYVAKTLSYSYERLNQQTQSRFGAVEALKRPTEALCQEFTDTFIALARAAGIPARELNGFAYTANPRLRPLSLVADVLHAWPEYYDAEKQQWIQVDPTWGNTTGGVNFFTLLDLNHIVFAIHGVLSEKPYPAGMYKIAGKEEKDVLVQVDRGVPQDDIHVSLETDVRLPSEFGVFSQTDLLVRNLTGSAWYDIPVDIAVSQGLSLEKGTQKSIPILLPYQVEKARIIIGPSLVFTQNTGKVEASVGDTTTSYETTVGRNLLPLALGIGAVILAGAAGGVLVLKRRR
ncbi:MAG TPA: hypothetical protein DCX25_02375 [Candidatus Pacebacteria bacterium]|nr:MAG: hypothetical protein UX00_C0004G0101 [Microgenomates group bacterium GW2011_GWB1_45_17]KKU23901.1 MAG: hypothetical protein UX35_C0003G0037 [Microgenomates group bacterium GW2011_GWA1_46_15]KKU24706.1 MAG: hypothetical protein UX36_C0001G0323 [Microgenomates group bacterium GW2011_GWC1_46_15]HAV15149.1 hypothetical protein [Candidatus Paceibacterota bacterium]HCR11139.1 hypothetical protein [Candidatus Paceibacterota bacterium]